MTTAPTVPTATPADEPTTKYLSADEFFADDLREEDVPHKGKSIRLRELTDAARSQITRQATVGEVIDRDRLIRLMVAASIVIPDLGPDRDATVDRLAKKASINVIDLYQRIEALNALQEGAVDAAKERLKSEP